MHHAVLVYVVERVADSRGDAHGALGGKLAALIQNLSKQAAVHPLHHHVDLAAVVVGEDLHHARMIELLADLLLALRSDRRILDRLPSPDAEL